MKQYNTQDEKGLATDRFCRTWEPLAFVVADSLDRRILGQRPVQVRISAVDDDILRRRMAGLPG